MSLLLLAGCRSVTTYRAASLPPHLLAVSQPSLRGVDLSQIASDTASSEVLNAGDLVEVTIATGLEEKEPVTYKPRVSQDGIINVPLVGPVLVGGLTLTAAEQTIRDESIRRGIFVNPNVSVLLLAPHTHRVTVVGAVMKPGTYDIASGSSNVLAAIVAAEGLTEDASTLVEVRHPSFPETWTDSNAGAMQQASYSASSFSPSPAAAGIRAISIDLAAGVTNPSDIHVEDGTTVMVRPREKNYIFVNGLVNKPDRYELSGDQELRLLDALALAGGRTLELADKVHVIRQVEDETQPAVILASVKEAKMNGAANIRLAPGDLVTVEETPITFVVGTIREFVRFGFTSAIPGF